MGKDVRHVGFQIPVWFHFEICERSLVELGIA